jgi:hypothetical protein
MRTYQRDVLIINLKSYNFMFKLNYFKNEYFYFEYS